MWKASNTSELILDDGPVPGRKYSWKQANGFHQMLQTLDGGRLSIGAMGLAEPRALMKWL